MWIFDLKLGLSVEWRRSYAYTIRSLRTIVRSWFVDFTEFPSGRRLEGFRRCLRVKFRAVNSAEDRQTTG